MYIFRVCVSAVWSGGPVQFYLGTFGGVGGGTVRIFSPLWLCSGGYGTVELVRGGGPFSLCFFQFAISSLGGWVSVVGILCYIFFVGSLVVLFRGFLFYKVLIVNNFFQVVSSKSEP